MTPGDERGTPSYILARLGDWTQELGQSPYEARHPVTWLREYVTDLHRQLAQAKQRIRELEGPQQGKPTVARIKFAIVPRRCVQCRYFVWLEQYSHHGYLIEGGWGEYLTLRYCQRCWP